MKAYKNIIVPTDGSVNSKRALEHAVVLASSLGASITLVYVANIVSVISNFDQIPNASGYVTEQVALDMEEEGKGVLDDFAKEVPEGIEVKTVFEVGSRTGCLIQLPKKYKPNLIVMGKPWTGTVRRAVYGIGQQLCRNSFRMPCPDCQINAGRGAAAQRKGRTISCTGGTVSGRRDFVL